MLNLKNDLIKEGLNVIDYNLQWSKPLAASYTPTEFILVHHDIWPGATMQNIHNDHITHNKWRGTGYNFRVRINGTIELGRPIGSVTAHCSEEKMNYKSVGIVFEGSFTDYPGIQTTKDMPIVQYMAGIKLIKFIMGVLKIPYQNVRPHRYYATYKDCPGKYFPLDRMLTDLGSPKVIKVEDKKGEIEIMQDRLKELGLSYEGDLADSLTRGDAIKMIHDALVFIKAIEPIKDIPVINPKFEKPIRDYQGSTHIIKLDPLSLFIKEEKEQGNKIVGNFSSGSFQGYWEGKFISIGTLVSRGKLIAKQLDHDPARGHLVVYNDATVKIEMIKDIEKERDISKISFAISGFNMEWNGMSPDKYLLDVEWFPLDVARSTWRNVIGYNPIENKIIIAHRPDSDVIRGQLTLKNLGCIDENEKILGIGLDSGSTVNGKFNDIETTINDTLLHHTIRWEE